MPMLNLSRAAETDPTRRISRTRATLYLGSVRKIRFWWTDASFSTSALEKRWEAILSDHLDEHFVELANHFGRAQNVRKAVAYREKAGLQALQRFAYSDALVNLATAIDLLRALPDSTARLQDELRLQLESGQALIGVKGWAARETEAAFSRAAHLAEALNQPSQMFSALWAVSAISSLRADLSKARSSAERLVQLAEEMGDSGASIQAYLALGPMLTFVGDVAEARRYLEQVMVLYDPRRHSSIRFGGVDPRIGCLGYLLWTVCTLDIQFVPKN
jgi:tetratricopeptide (TPR) repeat protein